ncbi:MAG: pseudouridine synthase [Anaerolineales bacterium]
MTTAKPCAISLNVGGHLYPVGRLDYESEGLVLMTNDGDLTNKLTHPKFGHEKEYKVLLARRPDADQLEAWKRGVVLEDGYKTQPVSVRFEEAQGKGAWVRVIMGEGRKRQIRETCAQLGLPVVRILRIRIGALRLGNLKARQWRYLVKDEVDALKGNEKPKAQVRSRSTGRPKSQDRPRGSERPKGQDRSKGNERPKRVVRK